MLDFEGYVGSPEVEPGLGTRGGRQRVEQRQENDCECWAVMAEVPREIAPSAGLSLLTAERATPNAALPDAGP